MAGHRKAPNDRRSEIFRTGVIRILGPLALLLLASFQSGSTGLGQAPPPTPVPGGAGPIYLDEQPEPGLAPQPDPGLLQLQPEEPQAPLGAAAGAHPFLLLTSNQIPDLQGRAAYSPWREMKDLAVQDCLTLAYDWNPETPADKAWRLRDMVSSCGLAYLLDVPNQGTYKTRLLQAYTYWDDVYTTLNEAKWAGVVPQGSAFFDSLLSLDLLYNDLSADQLSRAEAYHARIGEWFWDSSRTIRSEQNWYAVQGMWALYTGNRARLDQAKANYRKTIFEYLTPEGVYTNSETYAQHRLSSIRDAKAYFIDVLQFTGEDTHYYDNPRLQGFYEWDFGWALTPFRKLWTFGDTAEDYTPAQNEAAGHRAGRFSSLAAGHAAWLNQGLVPPGRLVTYLLCDPMPAAPLAPQSRIHSSAGAWFYEPDVTPESLAGALWNPIDPALVSQSADWYTGAPAWSHSHKDVNAIHLAAYGEHVLRNSGYAGAGVDVLGSSWDYIHNRALSNNTVMIDGVDHRGGDDTTAQLRVGKGVVEGFTDPLLDYASGDSGPALPNGTHLRNFVFVHSQPDLPGYFVLFDEVRPASTPATANVVLHPNADNLTALTPGLAYTSLISQTYAAQPVELLIFQGTAPGSVEIRSGALASWDYAIPGRYLYSNYALNGPRSLVTLLYPHLQAQATPELSRLSGQGFSGAELSYSQGVRDTLLEAYSGGAVQYAGVALQGKAGLYRTSGQRVNFYFVRQGTLFDDGKGLRQGFTADRPVSLFLAGKEGQVTSGGAALTLYYPGIQGVLVDGAPLGLLESGDGWARFDLPAGRHAIALLSPLDLAGLPLQTLELTPQADAEANANQPAAALGAQTVLGVDATPQRISYFKFDLSPLSQAAVDSLRLRFRVVDGSASTQTVYAVPDVSWSEGGLTFSNRPALGDAWTHFSGAAPGAWFEVNLSRSWSALSPGVLSFAIAGDGGDNLTFYSRESSSPPVLVADYLGEIVQPTAQPTGTSVPDPTQTFTPRPTSTHTPTPTRTPTPTTIPPSPTSSPGHRIFLPLADAEANANLPSANLGTAASLGVDYTPVRTSYLKFDLASLTAGQVSRAVLRVWVTGGSTSTQRVRLVADNSWDEGSLTYQNRPPPGTILATFNGAPAGAWLEVDLTSQVQVQAGGLVSFALDTLGGDNLIFNSRQSSANRPELVVSLGTPQPVTPTPARTPTPTRTPTRTPAWTPTRTQPASLLLNPSFETDTDGNRLPDGWQTRNTTTNDRLVTSPVAAGSYSFRFSPVSVAKDYRDLSQVLNRTGKSGDRWSVRLWVKTDVNNASGNLRVRLEFRRVGGGTVNTSLALPRSTAGGYTTLTFSAPADYTSLVLHLESAVLAGNAYVDDLSVSPP